jgi:arylsulfatase
MPTILELAGIQYPKEYRGRQVEPMMGRSLSGVLNASANEVYSAKDFVGGELGNGMWMRQGDYKAVAVAPPYGTGEWQLYNVVDDPGETQNLAGEKPELLNKLKAAWDRYAGDVGVVLSK